MPYMRDADWSSDRFALWKEPFVIMLKNGQKITIDKLGGMYSVDGIPGIFQNVDLSRGDAQSYDDLLNEVLQN